MRMGGDSISREGHLRRGRRLLGDSGLVEGPGNGKRGVNGLVHPARR